MSEEIVEHIFSNLKKQLEHGDIIFVRKGKTLGHVAIWSPNPDNMEQNFIHVLFQGLVYGDLKKFIKGRLSGNFTLEIFRLKHGKAISDQAQSWISSESIFTINNEDIFVCYDHRTKLASYLMKYAESLKISPEKLSEFTEEHSRLSNKNIVFLVYCNYAIGRLTKPTLNDE